MRLDLVLPILLLVAPFSQTGLATSITVNGLPPNDLPSINLTPSAPPSRLEIELLNTGTLGTQFLTAQVALQVLPIEAAEGALTIGLDETTLSFFGSPVGNISSDPGVVTAQVGAAPPMLPSLAVGERGLLAAVEVAASPTSRGEFALVALSLDPLNPLVSSQFSRAGDLGFLPFQNLLTPGYDGALLATFVVVPEPSCLVLVGSSLLAVGMRRRAAGGWSQ